MQKHGKLIAVVGPSGVGKDSIITGVAQALPDVRRIKRTITRQPGLGGEDYHSISESEFNASVNNNVFCLHWEAHGLSYGIPSAVLDDVRDGHRYIGNLSRGSLEKANAIFPCLVVAHIVARPETLAQRLKNRGRESEHEIAARLSRFSLPVADSLNVHVINNDGDLQQAIDTVVSIVQTET